MALRKLCLSSGWYPRTPGAVSQFLEKIPREEGSKGTALAAVAPHAGWRYSGVIAARAFLSLKRDAETVAVIGGHLPRGIRPLLAEEDMVETPFGEMPVDREFRIKLGQALGCLPDRYADNTVEVQLPMVHYFFPKAKLLWIRLPADRDSFEAGKEIAQIAEKLGRSLVVLGSTDLTHYGENYGYSPQGEGEKALTWVRDVNDANFITALKSGDPGTILDRAEEDRSACSVGAVLGALGFVQEMSKDKSGVPVAELLAYGTSAGENPERGIIPDSFVGYGAFCWR